MQTTVDHLEPYILECRGIVKLIVGHLMAVKAGENGRLHEALHEARALTDLGRRANFPKVTQLSAAMESVIEAAEQDGPDRINETLEVLCDMCAHVMLYVDSALLYADTVAMMLEYPWKRDALTRRLSGYNPQGLLRDIDDARCAHGPTADDLHVSLENPDDSVAAGTIDELERFMNPEMSNNVVVDLSKVDELPMWLLGALMSFHVALQSQGRHMRLTGVRGEGPAGRILRRLSEQFDAPCNAMSA